ncbi:esterase family protein [Rhodococcus sp. BP-349]|uniref:alpha/beta hydrolase n=1 Tax=unclassified Rhodococcus (in: high G+C Gram-positive bacteria) TaxID=192944 RepID=UPI001C9AC983|nr:MULTISPECIES: alpha/beta hydrolase family protein [unclassified Rhodococcus (in: high G+C Gram-positive bacteria)]MBY6538120.1 esterase family protein [Rhodococcus sp. BP-363]MBY6542457.1 esterase family protein [Rhodococcus sp. BP-369]MBY6561687.1 esterase family protein [Rhodococcus sp. BP-370]MBY6575979.1 esterase family protein [Rhodococcus sp. BP-364]MBY6585280.1 esterase family protein [Rhodococcus sp. BP-358]
MNALALRSRSPGGIRAASLCLTLAVVTALLSLVASGQSPARADDATAEPHVTSFERVERNRWSLTVFSPAMGRDIPLDVLRPSSGGSAPTLYLLNGAGGGEDGATWGAQTDVESYFADENVNVVVPARGLGSYYTDWVSTDPLVGKPMWRTFLTRELPPVVDELLETTGRNAVAGISMSATSVLDLVVSAPDVYDGVASFSGCARTSTIEGQAAVRGVVALATGADATNMWGPWDSPEWIARDPYVRAEMLRGKEIYLSSGSGLPGPFDTPDAPRPPGSPPLEQQLVVGGAIEAAARGCTEAMAGRLSTLGIPATIHLPPYGTHSWLYWQDELHRAWPLLRDALGRDRVPPAMPR